MCGASSIAMFFVSWITAAFDEPYVDRPGNEGWMPSIDAMFTIAPPVPCSIMRRGDALRREQEAAVVHRDDAVEDLGGDVVEGDDRVDPRVVGEDVDRTELGRAPLRELGAGSGVADVGLGGDGGAAVVGELLDRGLGRGLVDVAHEHVRAGFGEPAGDAEPDAHCATGDDRVLAGQVERTPVSHVVSPSSCGRTGP